MASPELRLKSWPDSLLELTGPRTVAFGPDGNLYLGGIGNGRVLRYKLFGTGANGTLVNTSSVLALNFSPDGNLYTASFTLSDIEKFDLGGLPLLGGVNAGSGGLSGPRSLTFGPDGNLYVASSSNSSVLKYDRSTGEYLGAFVGPGTGGLSLPSGIAFSQSITWSNRADITYGMPLTAAQLSAIASIPGSFAYTPSAGTVLNAGNSQTLSVDFTPANTANYNPASKSVSINVLKATPAITWSNPADISFGTSLTATQLNATASVPGSFVYTPPVGTVLNPGNGQTLSATSTPTDAANYNTSSKSVSINVAAAPAVSISSVSLTFSSQSVGTSSPVQIVTVTNTGNATLSIASIAVGGTNPGDFAQTNSCPPSVMPGASCAIGVTFTPTTAGTRSGTIVIVDTAPGSPHVVGLTATGAFNTPAGSNTVVKPVDPTTGAAPVTLTFSTVTQAGTTSVATGVSGNPPPSNFQLGNPTTYYNLNTTATFASPVQICINYTGVTFTDESQLRLFHFESGAWADHTVSLDTTNKIICASVNSLSPFAIFEGLGKALTSLGPAKAWIGLTNSDDVGIRFDLRAEVYRNGTQLVGSGEVVSVPGGGSGFSNANEQTINLVPAAGVRFFSGDALSVKLLVRNACSGSGKNSGRARLWYADAAANSRVDAPIGSSATYYFVDAFTLATTPGPGPKKTIDTSVGAKCGSYVTVGTWSRTLL